MAAGLWFLCLLSAAAVATSDDITYGIAEQTAMDPPYCDSRTDCILVCIGKLISQASNSTLHMKGYSVGNCTCRDGYGTPAPASGRDAWNIVFADSLFSLLLVPSGLQLRGTTQLQGLTCTATYKVTSGSVLGVRVRDHSELQMDVVIGGAIVATIVLVIGIVMIVVGYRRYKRGTAAYIQVP